MKLTAIIFPAADGGWLAKCVETGIASKGESSDKAIESLRETIQLYFEPFPEVCTTAGLVRTFEVESTPTATTCERPLFRIAASEAASEPAPKQDQFDWKEFNQSILPVAHRGLLALAVVFLSVAFLIAAVSLSRSDATSKTLQALQAARDFEGAVRGSKTQLNQLTTNVENLKNNLTAVAVPADPQHKLTWDNALKAFTTTANDIKTELGRIRPLIEKGNTAAQKNLDVATTNHWDPPAPQFACWVLVAMSFLVPVVLSVCCREGRKSQSGNSTAQASGAEDQH